ncbi:complex I intermediate-associated protein 30-domain-containing protein [Cladorrhinum samala]|uniref:Complex I intermediate-associated protein 30-domain-containing protein n=1 Tax=Cladorrhinum samala TaxID=585594 RepID=A0AAV9I4H6_9PEZI|nr:complex I intermediate-associated protein 30-domain-containing protein [Cladorrhinum samala]
MQATRCLQHKGFWGRSLDEFKRLSNIAFKLEGIKGATTPYPLLTFSSPSSVQDCKVFTDQEIGGSSTASLSFVHPTPSSPTPHARFHGSISTALPADRPEIKRTGYAAFRTVDRPPTVFGKSLWNIDPYVYLALRVKSDGRSYFVNVQTESVIPTDLHQHRLFVKKPGEWETVLIKWNMFVRTNHGFVVEPQTEILRQKVKSIGFGLTDRIEGPFELCVERVWATNDEKEGGMVVGEKGQGHEIGQGQGHGQLKTRRGETVGWGR